jgi:hypothetical protein
MASVNSIIANNNIYDLVQNEPRGGYPFGRVIYTWVESINGSTTSFNIEVNTSGYWELWYIYRGDGDLDTLLQTSTTTGAIPWLVNWPSLQVSQISGLGYTGVAGTPRSNVLGWGDNNVGRVKLFSGTDGPYPEDPLDGPLYVDLIWKRCDSTSTYNDQNYTDVRHGYNTGDRIMLTSYSIFTGPGTITGQISQATPTTFTTRYYGGGGVYPGGNSVYNSTRTLSIFYYISGVPTTLDENGNGIWNNSEYISGQIVPINTLYYTNANGNQLWRTLGNWNSKISGVGVNPTEVPWTGPQTRFMDLRLGTGAVVPRLSGSFIGTGGTIVASCDEPIAREIIQNGMNILYPLIYPNS